MEEKTRNQQNNNQNTQKSEPEDSAVIKDEIDKAKALGKELLNSIQKDTVDTKSSVFEQTPQNNKTNIPPQDILANPSTQGTIQKQAMNTETEKTDSVSVLEEKDTQNTEKKDETKLRSSIRTYANDIAGLIKDGATMSNIALSEQKRKISNQKQPKASEKNKDNNNRNIMLIGAIFVVLGILLLSFLFFLGKSEPEKDTTIDTSSIIFANARAELTTTGLNRADLLKKINQGRASIQNTLGSVTNIYLTTEEPEKRLVNAQEFLRRIDVRAQGPFVRSLNDDFMLGVHSFDGNQGFLIFSIKSFENALPGILSWEKIILDDLWPMFYNSKPEVNLSDSSEATSIQRSFRDGIIRNKDVRILENEDGTVLLYSFIDRKHLIITTEISTFVEVLDRLTTDRFKN